MATRLADCQLARFCSEKQRCFLNRDERICDEGMRRNDKPLMVGGFVIVGVGGAAIVAGALVSIFGTFACTVGDETLGDEGDDCRGRTLGLSILGAGAGVALAIGMPMAIAGAHRVPREDALPRVLLAPGAAALEWSF